MIANLVTIKKIVKTGLLEFSCVELFGSLQNLDCLPSLVDADFNQPKRYESLQRLTNIFWAAYFSTLDDFIVADLEFVFRIVRLLKDKVQTADRVRVQRLGQIAVIEQIIV